MPKRYDGDIISHALWMEKQGYRRSTILSAVSGVRTNICKVAKTVEDAKSLIEAGLEYVTDVDGNKLFRKR